MVAMACGERWRRNMVALIAGFVTAAMAASPLRTATGSFLFAQTNGEKDLLDDSVAFVRNSFSLAETSRTKQLYGSAASGSAKPAQCPVCEDAQVVGSMPPEVTEGSGLGESHKYEGVFYVVSDSTKNLLLRTVRASGELLTTYKLKGVDLPRDRLFGKYGTGDLESIAVAPCSSGAKESCIFVADTGHNCMRKSEKCPYTRPDGLYSIMRFPEPEKTPKAGATDDLVGERFWFRFPSGDGPWDVETLMATPQGALYIVTKVDSGPSGVYRIPAFSSTLETVIVAHVAQVEAPSAENSSPMFTGGSFRAISGKVVDVSLRTYTHILHFPVSSDGDLAHAFDKPPCVTKLKMADSEGFTWDDKSGLAFYSISEGAGTGIYKAICKAERSSATRTYNTLTLLSLFSVALAARIW
eukprot:gnl/TRDRNA2_/TRDRNA2_182152_c0_seq1.p1 gnl/TRDRNA2_/TRDRNA2_182152_c0~~gnl/TRDRNA2_/TRDRNA2_182152_c0_seq1.p1  ORF type:complete len:412 (+),score=66.22 gnl/TRDRNA2_/TRDRNA2_182152_c0_seq1:128-1363(+)